MGRFLGVGAVVVMAYFSFLTLVETALEAPHENVTGVLALVLLAVLYGGLVMQTRQGYSLLMGLSLALVLWSWAMPNMPIEMKYLLGREEVGALEHYLAWALFGVAVIGVAGAGLGRYVLARKNQAATATERRNEARRLNEAYVREKPKLLEELRAERVDWVRPNTVTGAVNHYIPAKQSGFIDGDDGVSYYFRKDAVRSGKDPVAGQNVAFEAHSTPKGARAKAIDLGPLPFEVMLPPDEFIMTKLSSVKGYEVTQVIARDIIGEFRGPDEARNYLKSEAIRVGANAVINLQVTARKMQEGNYIYTMHRAQGDAVVVMRREWTNDLEIIADAILHGRGIYRVPEA